MEYTEDVVGIDFPDDCEFLYEYTEVENIIAFVLAVGDSQDYRDWGVQKVSKQEFDSKITVRLDFFPENQKPKHSDDLWFVEGYTDFNRWELFFDDKQDMVWCLVISQDMSGDKP